MEFKTPEVKSAAVACHITENVSIAPKYDVPWPHYCLRI